MRLTKLKVAGFGPFLEEQVIDFRACNDAGLFMVAGPTGSGKTTLLDAIAFALYGETTGAGQGKGEDNGRQAAEWFRAPPSDPAALSDIHIKTDQWP